MTDDALRRLREANPVIDAERLPDEELVAVRALFDSRRAAMTEPEARRPGGWRKPVWALAGAFAVALLALLTLALLRRRR